MDARRLISSAALYGLADVATLAVGGFLLLPLYTRLLSASDFGTFVAVRANADVLTYVLQFGLPSALARLYLDRKREGEHLRLVNSLLTAFLVALVVVLAVFAFAGDGLWHALSPSVAPHPFLDFCIAQAVLTFLGGMATVWLRMEGRALAFVGLQLSSAAALATAAAFSLVVMGAGLQGVLAAILIGACCTAGALPVLLGRRLRLHIHEPDLREALKYALPILVGYLAHFTLNRFSTIVLQRYVPLGDIGVFGVAQQLASIVPLLCASFGMALQPGVYGARDLSAAREMLMRASTILAAAIASLAGLLVLFAPELLQLVAPTLAQAARPLMTALVIANVGVAFILVADTALLYCRRPSLSVAISVGSAVLSAGVAFWLVPRYLVVGAAASLALGVLIRTCISQVIAYRVSGHADVPALCTAVVLPAIAAAAASLLDAVDPSALRLSLKALAGAALLLATFHIARHRMAAVKLSIA